MGGTHGPCRYGVPIIGRPDQFLIILTKAMIAPTLYTIF